MSPVYAREERVDRNIWRFLIATFGVVVTLLLSLSLFWLKMIFSIATQASMDNHRQDLDLRTLQEQSAQVTDQLRRQQATMATLTATVQSLHDEVVRTSMMLSLPNLKDKKL